MTLAAVVVHLQAVTEGRIPNDTGRGVHGFWFRHWGRVNPKIADALHQPENIPPYTLSPLMALPKADHRQVVEVPAGTQTWFRVTTLTEELSQALMEAWVPALDGIEAEIPEVSSPPSTNNGEGIRWQITKVSRTQDDHPWAGETGYSELSKRHLFARQPPSRWRLRFATPTSFHGSAGHFPFPLPDSLIASWLRRWQAFAPIALPANLPEIARTYLLVSGYNLRTKLLLEGKRSTVGCVGSLSLKAQHLLPSVRTALDTLAAYAFYCGSGHRTTQGMGMTRINKAARKGKNPAGRD